jgi:hypothetical protein
MKRINEKYMRVEITVPIDESSPPKPPNNPNCNKVLKDKFYNLDENKYLSS